MIGSVCLFTDSLEPSGVGVQMLTLAAELQSRYDVVFVCPPTPPGQKLLERAAGMGLETLALEARGSRTAFHEFWTWLQGHQIEILNIHAGITWEGHEAVYAARAADIPQVVRTEHLPYLITKTHEHEAYRRALRFVDRIIAVSEGVRQSFVQAGVPQARIVTVRNGIHPVRVMAQPAAVREELGLEQAQLVLTVGRMTDQKGFHILLEAIQAIVGQRPTAHFLWAGDGPSRNNWEGRVRDIGLTDHIHFLGSRNDIPELMAASDLFVLPSLFEGLPLVVLEAMALGLPVVGTAVCGTTETVRNSETGLLAPPGNPQALAGCILEALAQPERLARWGAAGRELFNREFRATRMGAQTVAVFDELTRERATARSRRLLKGWSPQVSATGQ